MMRFMEYQNAPKHFHNALNELYAPDETDWKYWDEWMSFAEWKSLQENESDTLEERMGRNNWVKAVAGGLQVKVHTMGNLIKSTKDIGKKIDLLSTQMKWVASLATLAIATDIKDKSILKWTK